MTNIGSTSVLEAIACAERYEALPHLRSYSPMRPIGKKHRRTFNTADSLPDQVRPAHSSLRPAESPHRLM